MLKCASVFTYEIDNPEAALNEIKTQLSEKIKFLDNTVGIIMCHPEFTDSVVLKHVCEGLPFDVAGITTASQTVNDETGDMILTIFVMTSDDIWFRTGITDSINDNLYETVKTSYDKAAEGETEPPKLALIFPPYIVDRYSGDVYVRVWNEIIPGTPLFGTLAADDTLDLHDSETIYNGVSTKDVMSFILCYGNINPRFLIATLPENTNLSLRGKVTKSKNNFVYEVNDINARMFFTGSGIPDIVPTLPLMINQTGNENDGKGCVSPVPVIRELAAYSEDDTAIFGGDVAEGSTFLFLNFDSDSIKATSRCEIERINALSDVNGAVLFSCASRRMVLLGTNEDCAELKIAKDTIKQEIPFMLGYSGGEICPVLNNQGILNNRFHNYSMIILVI
ncbi:MAG: FIST C-terminal domain-containing protein [Treponema sp.]|nr:FIST C-terminal domain-containing protein [Treponema sp.]